MTALQLRQDQLHDMVKEHPIGTLAAAAGVGYLVGGGLFTRTTWKLLTVGWALGLQIAAGSKKGRR
jgi:hypothetical protein